MHEPAKEPNDLERFFVERVNAGDVEGLVALYESNATLRCVSKNPSGWVEFPAGEEPQFAVGHFRFEVQVGEEWKHLSRRWTPLRSSQLRTNIRAKRIQPGTRLELHFYAKRVRPTSGSVNVHLGDDSGLADRVQSWCGLD